MKRNHRETTCSAGSSRILSRRKSLNSSKASPNISNYFVKTKQQPAEETVVDELEVCELPYQNLLVAEIKPLLNDSLRERSDFKSAEPRKCRAGTAKLLSVNARKIKKSKPKQITMVRLMEKNFCNGDTNGDHLQLALALSRSMQDSENSSPKEEEEDLSAVCQPARGNAILEQFGFNSGRKLGAENKIVTGDAFKKRKRSRYQYVTPVLFLRTEEDRQKIIATKVSLILSQKKKKSEVEGPQQQAISLSSSYLQSLNKSGVYDLNQLTHEELRRGKEVFYLSNLKVPQSTCAGGYLLKDWNGIFGREATPPRDVVATSDESNKENVWPGEGTTPPPSVKKDLGTPYPQSQSQSATSPRDVATTSDGSNKENVLPLPPPPSVKKELGTTYHQSQSQSQNKENLSVTDETKVAQSRKTCVSPDLFESDDDLVVNDLNRSINEQLELSQRLINNFKSHSIFLNKSSSSEGGEDDGQRKQPATRSSNFDSSENECLEYESPSGICLFESFHDVADLEESSREIAQKAVEKLHDFYDLTATSSDDDDDDYESLKVSYVNKSRTDHFVESLLQSSGLERVVDCELEISGTSKECPIIFNASHHSSNKSDSQKILISDEGHFKKLDDSISKSFSSDANSFRHNHTCVSESDENLSPQQSDAEEEEEFQNKINCASESSLRNSFVKSDSSESSNVELCQESVCSKSSSSTANNSRHNHTCVSESDENLSPQQSDAEDEEEFQNKINCASESSLRNSFVKSDSPESWNVELSQESIICNKSFSSTAKNNSRHNYTCVSESDKNLSPQQSDAEDEEEFQNKINCASESSLRNSFVKSDSPQSSNVELSRESIICNSTANNYNFVSESDGNLSDEELFQKNKKIIPPADWGSKNSLRDFNYNNSFSSTSTDGNLSRESFGDEEVNYSSVHTKSMIVNLEEEEEFCDKNKPETSNPNVSVTVTNVATPDGKLIIKTAGITPMPNYTEMDTPGIAKELQKFGVKNLKRRRGVELLHYIYDSTHPLIPGNTSDGGVNPAKRRKRGDVRKKLESKYKEENVELVGDLLQLQENDLIFEKKQSARVASCRVPLHIAWFNLVASHPGIKESILLYEPLQLEVLYSLLKEQGYKYSMQDLLTFLDRKCITIRTNQNQRKTAAQNRIKVVKKATTSQLIL